MQPLVLVDRLGTYPDPLPEATDAHRLAPAVAEATPAALIVVRDPTPLVPVREAVAGERLGPDLGAVARPRRHLVARVANDDRIDEVLVQMVDVLDHPAVERARHAHVVDDREVLHELAQADAAGMRADRHAELGGHEQHGEHLVHAAQPARVDLAHRDRLCLQQLLEHHPVVDVLAGCDADRGHAPGDRRVPQDVVRAGRLLDPVRVELPQALHPRDRLVDTPALVGVDRQDPIGTDLLAHDARPASVVVDVGADLELEGGPPFGQRLAAQAPDLVVVVAEPADGGVYAGYPVRSSSASRSARVASRPRSRSSARSGVSASEM